MLNGCQRWEPGRLDLQTSTWHLQLQLMLDLLDVTAVFLSQQLQAEELSLPLGHSPTPLFLSRKEKVLSGALAAL